MLTRMLTRQTDCRQIDVKKSILFLFCTVSQTPPCAEHVSNLE